MDTKTEEKPTTTNQPSSKVVKKKGPDEKIYMLGSAECDQFLIKNGEFVAENLCPIPYFARQKIRISKICCGSQHTLVLSNFGKAYSWGCNDDAALGRIKGEQNQPAEVELPIPVDMVSAGDSHTLFCNSQNGAVYMCGVYRNILKGNMTPVFKTPVRIGEQSFRYKKIDKMISGSNHSYILTQSKVYAWGDPEVGVLARRPSCRQKFKMGLMVMQLPVKNVNDIFTGDNNGYCTKMNKKTGKCETYSWGLNNYGQLGIGGKEN